LRTGKGKEKGDMVSGRDDYLFSTPMGRKKKKGLQHVKREPLREKKRKKKESDTA